MKLKHFISLFIITIIVTGAFIFNSLRATDNNINGLSFNNLGGASVFQGYQGGTGTSTVASGDVGKVLQIASSSPFLTYSFASTDNWETAYTDRLKWDGGATGLTAATGRTSLGLGTMALEANIGSTTITTLGTISTGIWNSTDIGLAYLAGGTADANAYDFGGATSFEIPNSATNVVSVAGQIGIDTTSGQFRYNDGTATRTMTYLYSPTITLASTTLTGGSGTTTIPLGFALQAETWNSVVCGSSGGTGVGTTTLRFGDGTNYTNTITATSTAYSNTLTSNNSFTANEVRQIQIQSTAGSPNYISCTINKYVDVD